MEGMMPSFLILGRLDETLSSKLTNWKKQSQRIQMSLTQRHAKRTALLEERLDVVLQLSSAVEYMHSKPLLHRVLKPDNMGFQDGVLKIFDLDASRNVPETNRPYATFKLTK